MRRDRQRGYVGTRTDDGYADINLNYADSGGNANRQFFAQAGNADILDWAARTRSRYHSLQTSINRPFKGGLLLKGAYTFSKALNEADEDGWTGPLTWNQPSQHAPQLRAGRLRSPAHAADGVRLRAAVRHATARIRSALRGEELAGQRHRARGCRAGRSRSAATTACCSSRAGRRRSTSPATPSPASARPVPTSSGMTRRCSRSRATPGATPAGTPSAAPSNYNLDASLFRTVPIGSRRSRFGSKSQNVLNHPQWGIPVTGFTDPNFMRIRGIRQQPGTAHGTGRRAVRVLRQSRSSTARGPGQRFAAPGLFCAPASRPALLTGPAGASQLAHSPVLEIRD